MGTLYYGDNLTILREHIADESVDLVYLDPPFNSNANYNVLFRAPEGHQSHAQMEAFEDTGTGTRKSRSSRSRNCWAAKSPRCPGSRPTRSSAPSAR